MDLASKRSLLLCCVVVLSACQMNPVPDGGEPTQAEQVPQVQPEPVECICPVVEPPPPKIITQPCPEPVAPVAAPAPQGDKYVIGRVENVYLPVDGNSDATIKIKSRIDTGAGLTSMHANELVMFERDGKDWVRFALIDGNEEEPTYFERPVVRYVEIKQLSGDSQKRPVVSMGLRVGDIEEYLNVNLTDRSNYVYQILIGRNFLRDRAVVDVSRKFIADENIHFD